jgi:rare lipoprotein A
MIYSYKTSKPSFRSFSFAALISALLALVACSTTAPPPASPKATGTKVPGVNTPGPTAKSGGYYMDDGPGLNPPANLDSIADAIPRPDALLARANRPYVVFGQNYTPMVAVAPFKQRGFASWYGRKFHGQKTSSGEIYDMYAMTAAHPTLPLPSYVRVTHLKNGRSVVVRVNDRGPFLQKRVIDLSYAAANKLGYVNMGSAEVEVELITQFDREASDTPREPSRPVAAVVAGVVIKAEAPAPEQSLRIETIMASPSPNPLQTPAPVADSQPFVVTPVLPPLAVTSATSTGIFLQLGAFGSQEVADTARDRMAKQIDGISEPLKVVRDGALYKLHLGPYVNREAALNAAEKIRTSTEFKPFPVQPTKLGMN